MNTEALQKLFLEKLNSTSTDELIKRLDEVVPTGLGDVIDERRVYQCLSLSSDNFSASFYGYRQNNLEMYNDVELRQQSQKVLTETQQEQLESKYSGYDLDRMIESVKGQGSQTILTLSGSEGLIVEQIQTKIKETVEKLDKEKTGE